MVDLIDSTMQEFCAEINCETDLDDYLLLENPYITDNLDEIVDINEVHNYKTTLTLLYMRP